MTEEQTQAAESPASGSNEARSQKLEAVGRGWGLLGVAAIILWVNGRMRDFGVGNFFDGD